MDTRDMHAHFLKQAAPHHAHHAAALIFARRSRLTRPGRADKAAGCAGVKRGIGTVFQRLERGDDPARQLFEPGARRYFSGVELFHGRLAF